MSRYVNELKSPFPPESLMQPISQYMTNEGFSLYDYKGTMLWKKGVGIVTAPQYLSIFYGPDYIRIEAFIKYPILPGVYVGEMGTSGFIGIVPKRLLLNRVKAIEAYIVSLWNVPPQQTTL